MALTIQCMIWHTLETLQAVASSLITLQSLKDNTQNNT